MLQLLDGRLEAVGGASVLRGDDRTGAILGRFVFVYKHADVRDIDFIDLPPIGLDLLPGLFNFRTFSAGEVEGLEVTLHDPML